jgi:hypothetical protein
VKECDGAEGKNEHPLAWTGADGIEFHGQHFNVGDQHS